MSEEILSGSQPCQCSHQSDSPGNQVLQDNYERILAEFVPPGYDDVVSQESEVLNIVANDVRLITDWLREHRLRAAS